MFELLQIRWVCDAINDHFEAAQDEAFRKHASLSKLSVILAARTCIEEFTVSCNECAIEMSSRNPKIITHCRDYMQRYAEKLRSRVILELSSFMGPQNKRVMELGEPAIFAAIGLLHLIEDLARFRFIPKDFIPSLRNNLLDIGALMSAILDIAIERVEGWFQGIMSLPPIHRGSRLSEVATLIMEQISITKIPVSLHGPRVTHGTHGTKVEDSNMGSEYLRKPGTAPTGSKTDIRNDLECLRVFQRF